MNNAKMWLVVSPSVGVPIFLGAVAVGSFSVHVAVLSNTSWVSDFLSGQELGAGDAQSAALLTAPEAETAKAAYVTDVPGAGQEVTVILQDGTVKRAIIQPDEVLASAAPPLLQTN
ncbi:MAG: light-harvesting protein [Litoreibacter sp.]|nr:light-harvesting protein [Litoreibacter sp.]MCY4333597.1 light-harvesting protein [Litoreibacter sp.]